MIGCWLGGERPEDPWRKIGAIGVHLSRWITTHGLAFNVDPSMRHFAAIVPCGIGAHPVTSLALELGEAPALDAVEAALVESFAEVFGASLI
jgi:lipoyl(octanoyl) transferase